MKTVPKYLVRVCIATASIVLCGSLASAATGTGQITGAVKTAAGKPVQNAVVMLNILPGGASPYHAQTTTASDGTFLFSQLPAGSFQICPQAPSTNLLAPCTWGPLPPAVTLKDGQSAQMPTVQMQQGVLFLVRVNDPPAAVATAKASAKPADIEIGARTSSTMIVPMALLASDPNGYDFGCYVPPATPLQLAVSSSAFVITDATGQAIDAKNGALYTVQVPASGQSASSQAPSGLSGGTPTFSISGHK